MRLVELVGLVALGQVVYAGFLLLVGGALQPIDVGVERLRRRVVVVLGGDARDVPLLLNVDLLLLELRRVRIL